jgi:hypothetical protein
MRIPAKARDQLLLRFEVLLPHLNERQRRLLLATEARLLGHGGVRAVAEVAGVSETTVRAGVFELEEGQAPFPEGLWGCITRPSVLTWASMQPAHTR